MSYPKVFRRENMAIPGVFWYLLFEKPGEKIHAIDSEGMRSVCSWTEEQMPFSLYQDVTYEPEIQESLNVLQ